MDPIRFETVIKIRYMSKLFQLTPKFHHFEKVAKVELNAVDFLWKFSRLNANLIFILRIEEFLQVRNKFIFVKEASFLSSISLRQRSIRFDCDKEIGFDKILRHKRINCEVSSFWDSSAWKLIIQGLPGKFSSGHGRVLKSKKFRHAHSL